MSAYNSYPQISSEDVANAPKELAYNFWQTPQFVFFEVAIKLILVCFIFIVLRKIIRKRK